MTQRILIVKTSSLGDIIHTLPALEDAHQALPHAQFDWVIEEAFAEVAHWHPAVQRVIPVALRRWRKQWRQALQQGQWQHFKQQLRAQNYDAVIDAQGLLKSAYITRLANTQHRYGLDRHSAKEPIVRWFYNHPQSITKEQHAVERTRQLFAKSLGYPLPNQFGQSGLHRAAMDRTLENRPKAPYVMLLHGTTRADKHWPEPYWCALCNTLLQQGYAVYLPWGNPQEQARAERIAATGDQAQVLPKLNLTDIAGWLAGATAIVTVDTGLGHLAAALNVPTVALYGTTQPHKVGTYGQHQQHISACDLAPVTTQTEPPCFAPLTPEIVWQALQSQLALEQPVF